MHKKNFILLFILFLLTACTPVEHGRYLDTSQLEKPPEMKIVETARQSVENKVEEEHKGLGDLVTLAGTSDIPMIKIKKMFDRAWNIVDQALALNEIKVTDKNRDQGVYYVLYDPDTQSSKQSGLVDAMSFFFFSDQYEEAAYKLTVVWQENVTTVSAELIDRDKSSDLLDDDEDIEEFEGSVDNGKALIRALFRTIRDDLPLD